MRAHRLTVPLGLFLLALLAPAGVSGPVKFYVSTNGNDHWSGRLPAPNAKQNDGPFATLSGARDALRAARREASRPLGAASIQIRGGRYWLDSPFVLEPQDSGTANSPVTFEAYGGEKPVFSGGRLIREFHQNGRVWEAEVPDVKGGRWYFHQLFVNGQRRQRARSPNSGYHRIAKLIPGPPIPNAKPVARDQFGFAAKDLGPVARLADVDLVLMHSWETSIHPIESIDPVSNIVHFAAPLKEWWGIGLWEEAQRYYVENAIEWLDQPGEWYLNRETGVLTYWPLRGERLETTEVIAPVLTELVRFAGNADQGSPVQWLTLKGLTFHHSDWIRDPKGNSSTQAAVEVPAAVTADGALHCGFENCEVAHVGTYAVWFRRGCKDCVVQHNRIFDLGAGGIRVGEASMAKTDAAETSRTLVDNNHIFDGGHVFSAGIGIWLAQSNSNRISHNDIHDLLYSGMSVGWNWDDTPNRTHHNLIEFNHVHHLGHGVLSDAGIIYCLGVSPGSVIRNNVFHDIWPYSEPPFGWGIYLDATCGGYLVENNLVYNTLSGGLMFNNGGHEHVIQNNIFALSANLAIWPYFEKRPTVFRRNIVYLTQGGLFREQGNQGEPSLNARLAAHDSLGEWDENLYWHTGGAEHLRFSGRSFEAWQALGMDRHSEIAPPGFKDASTSDFRLQPDSPAIGLGFRPIDISHVGLYGDRAWMAEARHSRCSSRPLPLAPTR